MSSSVSSSQEGNLEEISSSGESGFQSTLPSLSPKDTITIPFSDPASATSDQEAGSNTAKDVASNTRVITESLGENDKEINGSDQHHISSSVPKTVASSRHAYDIQQRETSKRSIEENLRWTSWLKCHGKRLYENPRKVYGSYIDMCDGQFKGTAMHGLARSSTSFSVEEMRKIVAQMPKEQLIDGDADDDLPVHSAIKSLADQDMIALFVEGDSKQKETILCWKNNKDKTPVELAFEKRHKKAIAMLFELCVKHGVLLNLTGIRSYVQSSTLLHTAFKEDKPWFLKIVVKICQKLGEDLLSTVQVFDENNNTPFQYLMNCIQPKDQELKEFENVIGILVDEGININNICIDSNSRTMLHEAKRKHHKKCCEILLKYHHEQHGDKKGITPSQRDHHVEFDSKSLPMPEVESLNEWQSTQSSNDTFCSDVTFQNPIETSTVEPIIWEKWLEDNAYKMCKGNLSAEKVYGEFLYKRDTLFNGTATHGLARSCPSFIDQFEDIKKIVSKMPKEQLTEKDADGDLPVHSAVNSMAKQKMIALFVQGDSEKEKTILSTKNNQGKTPIELAFDKRHNSAIKLLYNLCVKHKILPGLTGFEQSRNASTILHAVFDRDDMSYWSRFLSVVINACKRAARDILSTITVLDERNCTPFYYLMNCMHPNHHYKLAAFEKVLMLLSDNEIDVNSVFTDSKKRTMLHEARRKRHNKCSEMLSRYGHKDDIEDIDGIKPSQRDHHITKFNSTSLSPTAESEILGVGQHSESGSDSSLEDTREEPNNPAVVIPFSAIAESCQQYVYQSVDELNEDVSAKACTEMSSTTI